MKKIIISTISVILTLTMLFSTTATAVVYTVDNLPYGVQTEPQQEQELVEETKTEIIQKLSETVYAESDDEDIIIRYYGSLSNGAMLINHYNKSFEYGDFSSVLNKDFHIKYANIDFFYFVKSKQDIVNLYIDGDFYTFKEAYELKLINFANLWEIEHMIDNFSFCLSYWGDVVGDINNDGMLSVLDATLIQKKVIENSDFTESEIISMDLNNDGYINISDVTQLQKIIANIA